ncbi:MAG: hypothetical protein SFV54_17450 [Bryobacteraceae bacterium]|nr:hypothetical protein [Bryobacteraceae bacterium]
MQSRGEQLKALFFLASALFFTAAILAATDTDRRVIMLVGLVLGFSFFSLGCVFRSGGSPGSDG